jgi:hypothetical protein
MCGYVSVFVFFLISSSWGAPVILTAGHEHVIAARRNWIDLKLRHVELQARLQLLDSTLTEFETKDLLAAGWIATLNQNLARERATAKIELNYASDALASLIADHSALKALAKELVGQSRSEKELKAGVIDRQRFLAEKVHESELLLRLTNLSTAIGELTVKERQAREKLASLNATERFLRNFRPQRVATPSGDDVGGVEAQVLGALSASDFLHVERALKDMTWASVYAEEKAKTVRQRNDLKNAVRNIEGALSAYEDSPITKAFEEPTVVVFAPYTNLGAFRSGRPVYACRIFLVWCSDVGTVGGIVDGEVAIPHPLFGRQIRGQFVRVHLKSQSAAQYDVLHVGSAPLLL